jgi:arylsulfatase A-like enzyme
VAVVALVSTSCAPPSSKAPEAPRVARNLVIVTIDTLRADRLGCYGSRDVATPHLDRIAQDGAMAPQAVVHIPLTRPSHASLFTGLLPYEHGIRDNVSPSLSKNVPTLAETLKAAGFETGAFVSSVVLEAQSGLDRGFDTYDDHFEGAGNDDARFLNTIQRRGDETVKEAVAGSKTHHSPDPGVDPPLHDRTIPTSLPGHVPLRDGLHGEVAWTGRLVGRPTSLERLWPA